MAAIANRPQRAIWSDSRVQALVVVALGLALRLAGLGAKSLWLDEAFGARLAALDLPQLLVAARAYFGGLAYYLQLHAWSRLLGRGEATLRLLSVLPSVLGLPLLYLIARRILGQREALVATLLLALSPLDIWYAQEARMYAQTTFLGLLCVYAYQRYRTDGSYRFLLLYALSALWGIYTLYSFPLILMLINAHVALLWLWRQPHAPPWAPWAGAHLAIVAGFLPWWPVLAAHVHLLTGDVSRWQALLGVLSILERLGIPQARAWWVLLLTGVLGIGAFLGLAALGMRRAERITRLLIRPRVALAWGVLPFVGLTALGIWRPNSSVRQLAMFMPWLILAAVAALGYQGRGLGAGTLSRWLLAGLIALSLAGVVKNRYFTPKEEWREAAHYLSAAAQPGDLILVHAYYALAPLEYYDTGTVVPQPAPQPRSISRLPDLVQGHERAWLVLSHDRYVDPEGQVERWFAENGRLVERRAWHGIRLQAYQLAASAGP